MIFSKLFNKSGHHDFSAVGIDMHSHLVPGVDDGSQNCDDSIVLVHGLKKLGFRHLYTTPHSFHELFPNSPETLNKAFSLLDGLIPDGINLSLSSEYYLDEQFKINLTLGSLLPLPGNRLLVEFSQISQPLDLQNILNEIIDKGYQPVLAHPERYLFFTNRIHFLRELKSLKVEFQLNALSLTGFYGTGVRSLGRKLVELDMIDFIATDLHHKNQLEYLEQVPALRHYDRLIESGLLKNQLLLTK